ncbi:MAG: purine-nucleoside phosphorylase [Planctomycetes bacterium]|nr:purine-nucleoside phosphorylase [Planctomycetota bacterium]
MNETVQAVRAATAAKPEVAIVLGSGLGALADAIVDPVSVPYVKLPHFPVSSVPGHQGRLVIGGLEGKTVVAMQGRVHYYEGYSLEEVTYPIRVVAALGAKSIIVTNSAGAVNREYDPGDLMLITDHLNLLGINPLRGAYEGEPGGPKFIDLTEAYDPDLIDVAKKAARSLKLKIRAGVYAISPGPSYETPAEVNMLRTLGADAIGMSTVPEVIVARAQGLRVAGISCIANRAAGLSFHPLTHAEVLETTARVGRDFSALVRRIVKGC